MARARKLHSETSVDGSFNELAEVSPDFLETTLFLLAIPHADDWGRLPGSAREFKMLVCPGFDVSFQRLEEALERIAAAGLWFRYEAENRSVVAFKRPTWERIQTYIAPSKRQCDEASKYPSAPDWQKRTEKDKEGQTGLERVKTSPKTKAKSPKKAKPDTKTPKGKTEKSKKGQGTPQKAASPSPSPSLSPFPPSEGGATPQKEAPPAKARKATPQQAAVGAVQNIFRAAGQRAPAGGLVGHWLKQLSQESLLELLRELARRGDLSKPAEYITAAVQNQAGRGPSQKPTPAKLGSDASREKKFAEMSGSGG